MNKNILIVSLVSLLSCVIHSNSHSETQDKDPESLPRATNSPNNQKNLELYLKDAKVKVSWQKKFLSMLQEQKCLEGWALFSESGYLDRGQVMLCENQNAKDVQIAIVMPGKDQIEKQYVLSGKDWQKLKPNISKFDRLKDFNPKIFDGVQYELIHVTNISTEKFNIKRVFMNNPGVTTPLPEHEKLIALFLDLQKKP